MVIESIHCVLAACVWFYRAPYLPNIMPSCRQYPFVITVTAWWTVYNVLVVAAKQAPYWHAVPFRGALMMLLLHVGGLFLMQQPLSLNKVVGYVNRKKKVFTPYKIKDGKKKLH
jgi:hypothetical protein